MLQNLYPQPGQTMSELPFHHMRCKHEDGVLVLTIAEKQIQGDDLADALRQEFFRAVDRFGAGRVVLDFREVHYLGSAGFRPLLSLYRKLRDQNGAMLFCNLSPDVEEVFQVTRLISSSRSSKAPFELAAGLAEAIARLRPFAAREEAGALVLSLAGPRLEDEQQLAILAREMLAEVSRKNARKVVLDLKEVEAIAPERVPQLLDPVEALHRGGVGVVLCGLRQDVSEAVAASGRAGPVVIAADVAAALARLGGPEQGV
jgi:anti-anti-sigma factor